MPDWPLVAVRLALYGDLGLLFGLPFFAVTAGQGVLLWRTFRLAAVIALLAGAGFALSLLGFAILAAQMSGTTLADLDPTVARILLAQTAFGWALIARVGALVIAVAVALFAPDGAMKRWLLAASGAIAVATLAWSGHGAASEGRAALLHLGGDILHLLAASAWIGALALLLALVSSGGSITRERVEAAQAALMRFSVLGTVIVALIVATGLANAAFTVGASGVMTLPGSPYGQLLTAKLAFFAAMLGCAALNRYWLMPGLAAAHGRDSINANLNRLRLSIGIETGLALIVLALVAWLGTLAPPMSAA